MNQRANPYDVLPYRSRSVEWTSPERLVIASALHGGPRAKLSEYRYLEVGCGDGSNLLPLAYYRPHAQFIGVDSSERAIEVAKLRASALQLQNLRFVCADLSDDAWLSESHCDFVVAHGLFSWISGAARANLLRLAREHLAEHGLVYVNYNARPGWNIRGLVRDFLVMNTLQDADLHLRCERARALATRAAQALATIDDPYAQLMRRELDFVESSDVSYVAHEFLAEHNAAFWSSEFAALISTFGLGYICEADFNYPDRQPTVLPGVALADASASALPSAADFEDLVHYRQLRCSILARSDWCTAPIRDAELEGLVMAAALTAQPTSEGCAMFQHPSGFAVEAKQPNTAVAFERLSRIWPRGLAIRELFPGGSAPIEDLKLLHRHGLIELRPFESEEAVDDERLHRAQRRWMGYATSRHHTVLKESGR